MQLYTVTAVNDLINKYMELGGKCEEVEEGVLGHGTLVLSAHGYKTCIVTERYLNEWSSGHAIRFYNEHTVPKKFKEFV